MEILNDQTCKSIEMLNGKLVMEAYLLRWC